MALKTIFHLDTIQRWAHLASNLNNYLGAEPDADIEVLVNGDSITVYFDAQVTEFIAAHPQVKFFACHTTSAASFRTNGNYRQPFKPCQLVWLNWHKRKRLDMGILSRNQ